MAERVPETAIAFRTNSVLNQFVAARADIGLALLPCYLSDSERELERITPEPMPELTGELWIVTRADLRRTACERAFFDIVGEGVVSQRELLGGERIVS